MYVFHSFYPSGVWNEDETLLSRKRHISAVTCMGGAQAEEGGGAVRKEIGADDGRKGTTDRVARCQTRV